MVWDQESAFYEQQFSTGDETFVALGANDQALNGLDASKRKLFIEGMLAYCILSSSKTKLATPENGVSFSGSWSNNFAYGTYGSNSVGSTARFKTEGQNLCIGVIKQLGNKSTFRVIVDGVERGNYSTGCDMTTGFGKTFGPSAILFKGLGEGEHTIEVQVSSTSGGSAIYFRFFSDCEPRSKCIVGSVPSAYSYVGGGSQSNVDAYNHDLAGMVDSLYSIGLDVSFSDYSRIISKDYYYDNVHPNNSGHLVIFNSILCTYDSRSNKLFRAPIVSSAEGDIFACTEDGLKRLSYHD